MWWSRYTRDAEVTGSNHQGYMRGKSCLTRLIALYAEMTGLVEEVKETDVLS